MTHEGKTRVSQLRNCADIKMANSTISFQGSRLDDQRCAPPPPPVRGPTVPDEDFFSLIMRSQAKRMDEQRVTLPSTANAVARSTSNSS